MGIRVRQGSYPCVPAKHKVLDIAQLLIGPKPFQPTFHI